MPGTDTASRAVLESVPLLSAVPADVLPLLKAAFVGETFGFGDVIVRQGEESDAFYVIVSGSARVIRAGDHGEEIALDKLSAGDSFGETGLLFADRRSATVRASSETEVLRLDRSVFRALVSSNPVVAERLERQVRRYQLRNFLRLHSVFARLTPAALAAVTDLLDGVTVAMGEVIFREGDPQGPMYLVEEGRLRARRTVDGSTQTVGFLRAGDVFGERSLLEGTQRTATIEAVSDCVLQALSREAFARMCASFEDFAAAVEERVAHYEYQRTARVPLDFAAELLPAEVRRVDVGIGSATDDSDVIGPGAEANSLQKVEDVFVRPARRIRGFPHVWQVDEADCGAAALAMVCRYFGRDVSLARVRQAIFATTDGTSLAGLAHGARELGLQARTLKASTTAIGELPLPAIFHYDGNHWVVVYDVTDRHVRVADPGRGRVRHPLEFFLAKWSGYAVLLSPTAALADTPEAPSSIGWLGRFLRPHRRTLAAALVLAFLVAGLQMLIPVFSQVIVDHVLPQHDYQLLTLVLLGMLAALVLAVGASLGQRYLLARAGLTLDNAMLDFLTEKLLALPLGYFAARRTGDIERRLNGMYQIRQVLIQDGVLAMAALVQLLVAVAVMFFYSWTLAFVYLACIPLYVVLMRVSARIVRPMFDSLEEAWARYQSRQVDAIKGIETVKAVAAESVLRQVMLRNFNDLARWMFRADFAVMAYQSAIQLVSLLSLALFLWVGALEVLHHNLTIGAFVSFNTLVLLANTSILVVLALWDRVQYADILLDRLGDVLENEAEQGTDHSRLRPVETLEGRIRLVRMGFAYPGPAPTPILRDIDLEVSPGMSIAIVGRSGSGKTTLIKCLAGLLEPSEGTILYDGIDLRALDYQRLRRQIGFVLQDNHMFSDSIAANIALGEIDPDRARVVSAAKIANAHEFITRLPLGYETKIGESGLRLSGGQAQRVAIARAVYGRPPILILDEATSALDAESERAVQENLTQLLDGRTSFVIAHRLSTVRNADLIIVIEQGRIVEQGTHEDLISRRGLYYYLTSQQLEL